MATTQPQEGMPSKVGLHQTPRLTLIKGGRQRPTLPHSAAQPGFLPLRQAADWAGVSEKTLRRWIAKGLPRYQARPREKVLIRPVDIEAFLTRKEIPQVHLDVIVDEVIAGLKVG
jgi:hypothetical protein